jgi:hypothetical protein
LCYGVGVVVWKAGHSSRYTRVVWM